MNKQLILVFLASCFSTGVASEPTSINIEADCYERPNSENAICYLERPTDIGHHYVELHRIDKRYEVVSLITDQNHGGKVYFSSGGKYMAELYYDEGHPSFVFYESDAYFQTKDRVPMGHFEDYWFNGIVSFTDDGLFSYLSGYPEASSLVKDCAIETENEYCSPVVISLSELK